MEGGRRWPQGLEWTHRAGTCLNGAAAASLRRPSGLAVDGRRLVEMGGRFGVDASGPRRCGEEARMSTCPHGLGRRRSWDDQDQAGSATAMASAAGASVADTGVGWLEGGVASRA